MTVSYEKATEENYESDHTFLRRSSNGVMGKSSPSPSRKLADLKRRRRDKMLEEKSGNERFTFHANFASQQPAEGSQLNLSEESSSDDQQDEEERSKLNICSGSNGKASAKNVKG